MKNLKIVLGENTYLKTQDRNEYTSSVNITIKFCISSLPPIIRNLIYFGLVDFLISPEWTKLKQCEECSKFFVTKTFRENTRFCCVKCRRDNNNRKRRESGKIAC